MSENEIQTVMIVMNKGKEEQYAHLLFQLIAQIPNFESAQPITESEYKESFSTIDNIPNGKVIFFGNGKETDLQSKSVNWQYSRYGMKYGWLGNRCVISADDRAISVEEQGGFVDYYNSRIEQFRPLKDLPRILYIPKGLGAAQSLLIKGLTSAVTFGNKNVLFKKDDIWKWQYELLVCDFVINGLVNFMSNMGSKVAEDQMIVVYDVKDAEYAHLLHNLIQQYSEYDIVEFTERLFVDNAKKLSSRNKIIFLGKTKSAKERSLGAKYIFDEYGMRFGWIGNHAFIDVESLKFDQREGFVSLYNQRAKKFESVAKDYAKRDDSRIGKNAATALNIINIFGIPIFGLPGFVLGAGVRYAEGALVDKAIDSANTVKDLSDYQYQLLLREFVFNGLAKFMRT
jgi:hypothetical protein